MPEDSEKKTIKANNAGLSPEAPAKDGELAINAGAVPNQKPVKPTPPPATDGEAPVIVSDQDVAAQPTPEQLTDQIEVLTGEIQGLESKIERLTGSAASAPAPVPTPAPVVKPTAAAEANSFVTVPQALPATTKPSATTISDIYPKSTVRDDMGPLPANKEKNEAELNTPNGAKTAMLIIAEVLIFFGIITFLLIAASPLYKAAVGEVVIGVLFSIGWPVTIVTSALGITASFIAKDTWGLRSVAIIVLLLGLLLYLGTGTLVSLGPVTTLFEPLFHFYR
jgi:hypothetical protein